MNNVLQQGDVITLEGNQKFYVVESVSVDGEAYSSLVKCTDNEEDWKNSIIVKESIKGNELYIEVLKDSKEIQDVLEKHLLNVINEQKTKKKSSRDKKTKVSKKKECK